MLSCLTGSGWILRLIFLSAIILLNIDVSSLDKGCMSPVILVLSRLALATSSSLAEILKVTVFALYLVLVNFNFKLYSLILVWTIYFQVFDTRQIFFMKVSGMTRLSTAEYKFILIVVFLNFNLLLLSDKITW